MDKITKKDVLTAIIANTNEEDSVTLENDVVVTGADIITFAEKMIEQLDNKALKAKEKAAEKKAAGDDLTKVIYDALTEDYQTVADIYKVVGSDEVTTSKIVYRLTALCKDGKVNKTDVKLEDGRKVKGYALPAVDAE